MTLHEAIEELLIEKGRSMSTSEIANELNRRKSYSKRDGSLITAFQIHGRAKNYPDLFTKDGSTVGLVVWEKGVQLPPAKTSGIHRLETGESTQEELKSLDTTNVKSLLANGFSIAGKLGDLLAGGLPDNLDLASSGVYAISAPADYMPEYISPKAALKARNVINPWEVARLATKWVEGVEVVYYGLAGRDTPRSLGARLGDFLEHGRGNTTDRGPHKGGEILWQLKGFEAFTLWVHSTSGPPMPRQYEEKLIQRFVDKTGKLPFANRQG